MHTTLVYYFNNCHGSDHAGIYDDPRAFFDLNTEGPQSKKATDLVAGQICIVCSQPNSKETVTFHWHEFQLEKIDGQRKARFFTGNLIGTEEMPKSEAASHKVYGHFFNVNGHFKQQSALESEVDVSVLEKLNNAPEYYADDIPAPPLRLPEGARRQIVVNAYERNPRARKICIEHYGEACAVCNFSFGETYGEFAVGFIHVHHLTPLHEVCGEYEVDPIKDLIPVCPNCHAAIHIGGGNRTVEEMKALLNC